MSLQNRRKRVLWPPAGSLPHQLQLPKIVGTVGTDWNEKVVDALRRFSSALQYLQKQSTAAALVDSMLEPVRSTDAAPPPSHSNPSLSVSPLSRPDSLQSASAGDCKDPPLVVQTPQTGQPKQTLQPKQTSQTTATQTARDSRERDVDSCEWPDSFRSFLAHQPAPATATADVCPGQIGTAANATQSAPNIEEPHQRASVDARDVKGVDDDRSRSHADSKYPPASAADTSVTLAAEAEESPISSSESPVSSSPSPSAQRELLMLAGALALADALNSGDHTKAKSDAAVETDSTDLPRDNDVHQRWSADHRPSRMVFVEVEAIAADHPSVSCQRAPRTVRGADSTADHKSVDHRPGIMKRVCVQVEEGTTIGQLTEHLQELLQTMLNRVHRAVEKPNPRLSVVAIMVADRLDDSSSHGNKQRTHQYALTDNCTQYLDLEWQLRAYVVLLPPSQT